VTAQSGLHVGQLAAALGLKKAWIDERVRNYDISCTFDRHGHRLYELETARTEIEHYHARHRAAPGFSTGGVRRAIDGVNLAAWASRAGLEGELPEIVRLLLVGSGVPLKELHILIYEGTGGSGWDGVVEAPASTRHIPFGTSVWEMGRNQRAGCELMSVSSLWLG
jgi:hypothetical protein